LGDAALVAARQALRKRLAGLAGQQAMEALLAELRRHKTNAGLLGLTQRVP
jgi:hypothetical protein